VPAEVGGVGSGECGIEQQLGVLPVTLDVLRVGDFEVAGGKDDGRRETV
jgi:hypothetical protein